MTVEADVIVLAGVDFMAGTAKLLGPGAPRESRKWCAHIRMCRKPMLARNRDISIPLSCA